MSFNVIHHNSHAQHHANHHWQDGSTSAVVNGKLASEPRE